MSEGRWKGTEDGGLAGVVEAEDQDLDLLLAGEAREQLGE